MSNKDRKQYIELLGVIGGLGVTAAIAYVIYRSTAKTEELVDSAIVATGSVVKKVGALGQVVASSFEEFKYGFGIVAGASSGLVSYYGLRGFWPKELKEGAADRAVKTSKLLRFGLVTAGVGISLGTAWLAADLISYFSGGKEIGDLQTRSTGYPIPEDVNIVTNFIKSKTSDLGEAILLSGLMTAAAYGGTADIINDDLIIINIVLSATDNSSITLAYNYIDSNLKVYVYDNFSNMWIRFIDLDNPEYTARNLYDMVDSISQMDTIPPHQSPQQFTQAPENRSQKMIEYRFI